MGVEDSCWTGGDGAGGGKKRHCMPGHGRLGAAAPALQEAGVVGWAVTAREFLFVKTKMVWLNEASMFNIKLFS